MTTGVRPPVPPWWPPPPYTQVEPDQVRELYRAVRTVTPGMIAAIRAWMAPQVPPGTPIHVAAQRPRDVALKRLTVVDPLHLIGIGAATRFGPDSLSVSIGIERSGELVVWAPTPQDRMGAWGHGSRGPARFPGPSSPGVRQGMTCPGWSERTARNLMRVAEVFGGKSAGPLGTRG